MVVKQVVSEHTLGLPDTSRRVKIYKDNIWVDTKPIHIKLKVDDRTRLLLERLEMRYKKD